MGVLVGVQGKVLGRLLASESTGYLVWHSVHPKSHYLGRGFHLQIVRSTKVCSWMYFIQKNRMKMGVLVGVQGSLGIRVWCQNND
jgi:hypothetical protein